MKATFPVAGAAVLLLTGAALCGAANNRRITQNGSAKYEAFPDVCKLADGDLIACFYAGYAHASLPRPSSPKGGRICIMRSRDGGATWSKPRTLIDLDGDDRDPSVMQTRKGTVICTFMTYYGRSEVPISFIVRVMRSADGGKTWDAPKAVESPFRTVTATSSPVAELKDGTLLMPIYGRDTKSRRYEDKPGLRDRSALLRSTDDGKTWGNPVFIDPNPEVHLQEPSIVPLEDGRLLCVMRRRASQSFSDAGGRTWSKPTKFPHRADCPYLLRTKSGVLLCASRHRGTSVTLSTDKAKTWGKPISIDTGSGAYPSMVELDDGRILCLYYREHDKGAGSSIWQAIFRVRPGPRIEFQ